MQATGAALRAELGEAQAGLAAAGGSFLRVLDMMQEAARVQAAIRDSKQARGTMVSGPTRSLCHGRGAPLGLRQCCFPAFQDVMPGAGTCLPRRRFQQRCGCCNQPCQRGTVCADGACVTLVELYCMP